MSENQHIENEQEKTVSNAVPRRKRTLRWWLSRVAGVVLATPVLLFLVLSVLIYIPPVQKIAVDMAADYLSEATGMKVSVGDVRLSFPLDLVMHDVSAVQDGDTIARVESLEASVRLVPLFSKDVEIDGVCLRNVWLDTRDMVEACLIRGKVGEVGLNSHSTSLSEENAVISKAWLTGADLDVVLADSVAEDTTESEPVTWNVVLKDVMASDSRVRLRNGRWNEQAGKWIVDRSADAMDVSAKIGNAAVSGTLALADEIYSIDKVVLEKSAVRYADMLSFEDVSARVDSVVYKGTGELTLAINGLRAREKSGLRVESVRGHVMMDSLSLNVPDMMVLTDDSDIRMSARMDLNAFDSVSPGTFDASLRAQLGKGDIMTSTKIAERFMEKGEDLSDVRSLLARYLSAKPVEVDLCADGNMENLRVSRLHAFADRLLTLDGTTSLTDSHKVTADAKATLRSARVNMSADYDMSTEAYRARLGVRGFRSSDWMRLDEPVRVSGDVTAVGRGLDVFSRRAKADVRLSLPEATMGKVDLSSTEASLTLADGNLMLTGTCNNEVLQTSMELSGVLNKGKIDAGLDVDLPLADIFGMGLSEDVMSLSTHGNVTLTSNLDNLFMCEAHVEGLDMVSGDEHIVTQDFDLKAETTVDSTYANLSTGDLSVDFHTPYNLFKLSGIFDKLMRRAQKQFKEKNLNIDDLKAYLPYVYLRARMGRQNPLAMVLGTYDVSFNEMKANVDMGPENGVVGDVHMYSLRYDTISVDTTYIKVYQDKRRIAYKAGVVCSDQPMFEAFSAYIDGYLAAAESQTHLTFFNKAGEKGIDIGVQSNGNDPEKSDTLVRFSLFPERPILAYREFELNKDNYVSLCKDGHIDGDVRLRSLSDDCSVMLSAGLNVHEKQWANAVVDNLNIEELVKVLPFMPKMTGLLYVDAMFNQNEKDDNFWVGGTAGLKDFSFEDMRIGNLETDFDYKPEGLTRHNVQGQVIYNGVDVAYLNGSYNAEGEGDLDASLTLQDIPVELFNPFIPDQVVSLRGNVAGVLSVKGPTSALVYNGDIVPSDVHVSTDMYSVDLRLANDTISIKDSKLMFNKFLLYGAGERPLTINGNVDFSDMENMGITLAVYGRNFKLIEAKRSGRSLVFGDVYADFFTRVTGTINDMRVRGMLNVLNSTDVTYIMSSNSVIYQGDRLDDIVTFVDFSRPPDHDAQLVNKSFVGVDMQMTLNVEEGARFNCELSPDRQSYVNVQGGGSVVMTYTPEGVLTLQGRLTVNEGEMKYNLSSVVPLKTFTIANGSYVEFTGEPLNPTLNIAATERTKAAVSSSDGASRSVTFDVGLKITNSLENMGLEFTIEAPEDLTVQNELASLSKEEKNKLAVALLATGMYLSSTNATGFSATNALNNFLQSEINKIAGQALATTVNVEMGMEQTTRDDGSTRTDYSFRFSKRFFSDRLNVIIGGKVSSDGGTNSNESGAYIDDVSLEWRLDKGGSRYVRIFHEKDYSNLIEGELDKNGAGVVLRKKVDKIGELFQFGNKNTNGGAAPASGGQPGGEQRQTDVKGTAPASSSDTSKDKGDKKI